MKSFFMGVLIGILITIFAIIGWNHWKMHRPIDDITITNMGKVIVEKYIDGAKVLNVVLINNYKESVDYAYDKMYGIEAAYEINGKVKKITFPLSKYKEIWISPNKTQLFILDKEAKVVN